jgi:hypothetical protein
VVARHSSSPSWRIVRLAEFGKPRTMGPFRSMRPGAIPTNSGPAAAREGLIPPGSGIVSSLTSSPRVSPMPRLSASIWLTRRSDCPELLVDRFQLAARHADPDAITELHHQIVVSQQIDVPAPDRQRQLPANDRKNAAPEAIPTV